MEQQKIDRINQLARKSKSPEGLAPEERAEQAWPPPSTGSCWP